MHWDTVIFHAELKALILGGSAVIGAATIDVDPGNCLVTVSGVKYTIVGVEDLHHLLDLVKQGIKPLTAYPSQYMDAVAYFLARLGLPRYMYRVVNADPRTTPFKAVNGGDVVRNIAYIHGIKQLVIARQLHKLARKTSYAIHAILRTSGYNADETLASRYNAPTPCRARLA